MAVGELPVRSCLIDGEAIVCDENGLAVFDLIRRRGALASAVYCAFDLLELDGWDLRRQPIERRKGELAKLLKGSHLSIVLNEHYEGNGKIVFEHACKLGCGGHCLETARLAVSPWTVATLDQGQKPKSAGREARDGGGLGR
jgi:bifunctional non-homologous end joining protein LigD